MTKRWGPTSDSRFSTLHSPLSPLTPPTLWYALPMRPPHTRHAPRVPGTLALLAGMLIAASAPLALAQAPNANQDPNRPNPPAPAFNPAAERVSDAELAKAIADGVAHLLAKQSSMVAGKDNSEWPYEGVYRVRGQIPEGYRVGGTAICALALIEAPGYADDPARKDAVARAIDFIIAGTDVPLLSPKTYEGGYDVRSWAYIYAIEFFARLKNAGEGNAGGYPADKAAACDAAMKWYIDALEATEIPKEGGWNYARRGKADEPSAPSSFMTGPALQALFEARKAGYDVDDAIVGRAMDFLEKTKFASGAVAYSGPATGRLSTGSATPGAVGRMLVVETTLVLGGRGDVDRVRGALDAFIVHWDWLKQRKQQTGTHVAPYGVAPYYFMFAHRYAAQAIEVLPVPERPEYRRRVNNLLFSVREEDGSWNDRVFPRSSAYGTAFAMLAMLDASATPPAKWTPKAAAAGDDAAVGAAEGVGGEPLAPLTQATR